MSFAVADEENLRKPTNVEAAVPRPYRLAILRDYEEENWPSMDLCAEMLLTGIREQGEAVWAAGVCPVFYRRLGRLPVIGRRGWAFNADRLLNRLWDYPRHLRRRISEFDLFHVCDHSYSQLVHALPADRTGVFCHDLDAFQCLFAPDRDPRPRWFRSMMRRVLHGLQKAAVVFYSTEAVRSRIAALGLIAPRRLVHAPYGISPEFTAVSINDAAADQITARLDGHPYLLHVGSCIPRKRMDVLLEVFARVKMRHPDLRLLKVGGPWSTEQQSQIARLGVSSSVVQVEGLTRATLAALYRQASLVLMPSEAEGFGLPVIEALACGAPVVASDLPVFREVAESAADYCPVGAVDVWVETVLSLLANPAVAPDHSVRLARAGRYTWTAYALSIAGAYIHLMSK